MPKYAEFIILGAVVFVAIIGLFTTFRNADKDFDAGGLGGAYEEDAASALDFSPSLGGRGRRYVEDAASFPEFNPLTNQVTGEARRGRHFARRAW